MSEAPVVDIDDRTYWSLSQLSRSFGPARETISKRLYAAGVKASRKRGGHDVYHIAEAAAAILADGIQKHEPVEDPDQLPPKDRLDWYKGENEKTKYLREAGTLIHENEVAQEMAHVVKTCVRTIETLPDVLEMKCGLSSDVINLIEAECDNARIQLAADLAE